MVLMISGCDYFMKTHKKPIMARLVDFTGLFEGNRRCLESIRAIHCLTWMARLCLIAANISN